MERVAVQREDLFLLSLLCVVIVVMTSNSGSCGSCGGGAANHRPLFPPQTHNTQAQNTQAQNAQHTNAHPRVLERDDVGRAPLGVEQRELAEALARADARELAAVVLRFWLFMVVGVGGDGES